MNKPGQDISDQPDFKALHKNVKIPNSLRPQDITLPGNRESVDHLEQSDRGQQLMKNFQGEIAERSCIQVATKGMGWKPELDFEQTRKGFDGIFRDNENSLVVVESKFTEKNGIKSLGRDQMSVSGIESVANKMQDPSAKDYYSPGNAKIGAEIINTGPENVRRVLMWLEPSTLQWTAFEGQADNSWEPIRKFDARNPEFDGPYIEF